MNSILGSLQNLKLKHLLVFERVVTLGSTHKVAEALHMTQPAVVKMIQQIEAILDTPLFERSSKGLEANEAAMYLLERINPILGDARAISEDMLVLRQGGKGHVRIGTLIAASAQLLPETIAQMKARYPSIELTVHMATNDVLYPQLYKGGLDIVVGRLPECTEKGLISQALYEEHLVLVAHPCHPLTQQTHVTLQEVMPYPVILPLQGSPVYNEIESLFAQHQLNLPDNRMASFSFLTNLGVLMNTHAVSFMPAAASQPFIRAGLLCRLPSELNIPFGAIGYTLREGRVPTLACSRFIDTLQRSAASIQPPVIPS